MAKKKENKAIGYIILSFIPLFGIIMAAVEGIQHNGFVKEARAAELKFEEKFLNAVNNNELMMTNNFHYDKLNITCAIPAIYPSRLSADNTEGTGPSHSITLSANPYVNSEGKTDFELVYEFFVTPDEHEELVKNYYDQEKITILGTSDFVYETYYPHNPQKTPIYAIEPLFDKYKDSICTLISKDVFLKGISSDSVIEAINSLPASLDLPFDTLDDDDFNQKKYETECKKLLKAYEKAVKACETEYDLLSEAVKVDVTNRDELFEARSLHSIRNVEFLISVLPNVKDFKFTNYKIVKEAIEAFKELELEELKNKVYNKEKIEEISYEFPLFYIDYFMEKSIERKCSVEDKGYSNYKSAVLGIKNTYEELSQKQKIYLKESGILYQMIDIIDEYNLTATKKSDKVNFNQYYTDPKKEKTWTLD